SVRRARSHYFRQTAPDRASAGPTFRRNEVSLASGRCSAHWQWERNRPRMHRRFPESAASQSGHSRAGEGGPLGRPADWEPDFALPAFARQTNRSGSSTKSSGGLEEGQFSRAVDKPNTASRAHLPTESVVRPAPKRRRAMQSLPEFFEGSPCSI